MSRMTILVLIAVLVVGGCAISAWLLAGLPANAGQLDTILLGSKYLTLGMSEERVRAILAPDYALQTPPGSPSIFVRTKKGPPYQVIGSLTFKQGALTGVSKSWGPEHQRQGAEFARALFGALSEVEAATSEPCFIQTSHNQPQPDFRSDNIKLICGRRSVYISVGWEKEMGYFSSIDEMVGVE